MDPKSQGASQAVLYGVGLTDADLRKPQMASPATGAAAALLLLLAFAVAGIFSDASYHRFKSGETVPLYANKVGPFHNPRCVDRNTHLRTSEFAERAG